MSPTYSPNGMNRTPKMGCSVRPNPIVNMVDSASLYWDTSIRCWCRLKRFGDDLVDQERIRLWNKGSTFLVPKATLCGALSHSRHRPNSNYLLYTSRYGVLDQRERKPIETQEVFIRIYIQEETFRLIKEVRAIWAKRSNIPIDVGLWTMLRLDSISQ